MLLILGLSLTSQFIFVQFTYIFFAGVCDDQQEPQLENTIQELATKLAPVFEQVAPDAYANHVRTHITGVFFLNFIFKINPNCGYLK